MLWLSDNETARMRSEKTVYLKEFCSVTTLPQETQGGTMNKVTQGGRIVTADRTFETDADIVIRRTSQARSDV